MYAIIETGGKQYRVKEGDVLRVEKLNAEEGSTVDIDRVLLLSKDGGVKAGAPYLKGAKVVLEIIKHGKGRKIIVFKYKPKKNYRRKKGHRQPFTEVIVKNIVG